MNVGRQELFDRQAIVRAKPSHTVRVTVMDVYNKPLAGTEVYAAAVYGQNRAPFAVGKTDSGGQLQVGRIYEGTTYMFSAVLTGYYSHGTGNLPKVGSSNWIDKVEIIMDRANAVSRGRVVDEKGRPVPNASVSIQFGPRTVTNKNGEFALRNMPGLPVPVFAKKGNLFGSNFERNRLRSLDTGPIVLKKVQ